MPKIVSEIPKNRSLKEVIKKDFELEQDFENYFCKYIVPEVVSYRLANFYYRNCLENISLKRYYVSITNIFNIFPDLDDIKNLIKEILELKYNLTIKTEDPLIINTWRS
mgnify:FL=1